MYDELLIFPAIPQNINIQLGSASLNPTKYAQNLGVIFDDQLHFSKHVVSVRRSCRFTLYKIQTISHSIFYTTYCAGLGYV